MAGIASIDSRGVFALFALLPAAAAARGLAVAAAKSRQVSLPRLGADRTLEIAAKGAERKARNLSRLTGRLDAVVALAATAKKKLEELLPILSDMRKAVTLSQNADATEDEKRTQANIFDQLLGDLNSKVRSAGTVGNNLIGNSIRDIFAADTVTFQTRPDSPVSQSITGVFSGSDFVITDLSGNEFVPDIFGALVDQLPIDNAVSGTLLLDDDVVTLDNDTGAVTITRAGDASPILEGTLTRKGLGVLFSPFYGHFLDDAELAEAITDIDAAVRTLRNNIAITDSNLSLVTAFRNQNDALILENERIVGKVQAEIAIQQIKRDFRLQQQELLFSSALNSTLSFNDQGLLTVAINNLVDFQV